MKLNAIALALGLASSSAFAGTIIMIDPDGLGSEASQAVGGLGWNNGNSISLPVGSGVVAPVPDGTIQTYGQAALANFNDQNGNTIGGLGLNSSYQWTYVFGALESATFNPSGSGGTANFETVTGGDNFFRVYFNTGLTASNVNGTGFTSPTLIMAGTISPANVVTGFGYGNFTGTSTAAGPLDQNVANNYPGLLTTTGTGSTNLEGILTYTNPDFIKSAVTGISLSLNTFNSLPFRGTDPSSCFTDGAGNPVGGAGTNTAGGTCINNIGTVNGNDGPGTMFMTRASSDFYIPEPSSMALVGVGLLSALGLRRKRA